MELRLSKPARGASRTDQNTVSTTMSNVIDHERIILWDRDRYVFRHITSEGEGAGFANSFIGSGSMVA